MKEAVKEIFSEEAILDKLTEVANEVRNKLQTVTSATLGKIGEMNPEIAQTLNPSIPSVESLKWADVFKMCLSQVIMILKSTSEVVV